MGLLFGLAAGVICGWVSLAVIAICVEKSKDDTIDADDEIEK